MAFEVYGPLRAKNYSAKTVSVAMQTALKDDLVHAFTECNQFIGHLKEQKQILNPMVNEFTKKHPTYAEYYQLIFELNDSNAVESEISVLTDALECLKLKKSLMSDNVIESGNLLEVLKGAIGGDI